MVKKTKKKVRIFLIEDDQLTIDLYRDAFQVSGFEITVFDFGQKAIDYLRKIREGKEEKPDLILLDLILPDMNGILVLEEARKYPETEDLIILALTNYTDPQLDKELVKNGINKILLKTSYTPSRIIAITKDLLKTK